MELGMDTMSRETIPLFCLCTTINNTNMAIFQTYEVQVTPVTLKRGHEILSGGGS